MISESQNITRTKPISPWWNTAFKLVISFALIYLVYHQVVRKQDLSSFVDSFRAQFARANTFWIWTAFLLMPINFALENMKWRSLLASAGPVSFMASMKAILCGSTLGIMTPNRLGEYGGRVLYIDPEDNWKAIYATVVGNIAQLIILIAIGWVGTIVFFNGQISIPPILTTGSVFIGLLGLSVLILIYFNIDLAINLINRIKLLNRIKERMKRWKAFQQLEILRSYESATLLKAMGLAFVKYLVYTTQYVLLLYFFGIEIPLLFAYAGVSAIYLIQTSIPLPAFIGLVARGELALLIWGYYSDSYANILGATFTLWVINLLIPAIAGLVLIYKVNILKSLGYD